MSLIKIRRQSRTLTRDPGFDWIDNESPPLEIGKVFLTPSNRWEKSSRTSNWPRDHAVNTSLSIVSTVKVNSSLVIL